MKENTKHGSEFLRAMDHYLLSLIRRRDFAGAVEYFESHRSELDGAGDAVVGSIHHHAAMAYASLSNYPAALKAARMAQHLIAKQGDSELLAEVFFTLGGILRDMGKWKEAEKAFRDAESIFRRRDCLDGQCRVLNQLAGMFYQLADYRNALSVLLDAVALAQRMQDHKKIAFMMGNIGRIYTFLGNSIEAQKHLQANIDLSTRLSDWLEVARAQLALGYLYIQQGRYDEAEELLDSAYGHLVTINSSRDEAIYLSYLGELRYQTGRLEEANEALAKALKLAEAISPSSTLAARIKRHLAELRIRQEHYTSARRLASEAMVVMEKAGNRVELGALWRIKAVIAAATGQGAPAKVWFDKAVDMLNETGVRFEEAQTLTAAGSCELFSIKRRLTYLFRAEEIYRRARATVKTREVESLIHSLDYPSSFAVVARSVDAETQGNDKEYLTNCAEIKRFKAQLPVIGRSDLVLLLQGETGVGKDHMARYFHSLVKPDGPFVVVNCATVPATLLESELFGYHRGAFTGADGNKEGLFAAANGGVLYLDEIGDIPLELQAKLLGVLETRRVTPLGSTREIALDIKLVAATNKNLEEMIECGTFRRDLYYRLSGYAFRIPPLRQRKEDIPLLLRHFMERCNLLSDSGEIPSELVHQFVTYHWPGNVRELSNKVKQLTVMAEMAAEGDLIELSRSILFRETTPTEGSLFERVERFERQMLIEALLAAGGNKSQAARILGIHEATVRTKLKRYGITVEGGVIH
jgi:transcriptional regulator with PAS, ATPase and Fis domain